MSEMAPGWYPDPDGANQQRFWDGDGWTDYFQPLAPAQEEVRGAATATQDYPYLANASAPAAPATGPITDGWSDHTPTTAWGTPAAPGAYVQQGSPPGLTENWTTADPTQQFSAGKPRGRGGMIAIVAVSVVVIALLLVGGFLAFRNGASSPSGAGIGVNEQHSDSLSRDEEWIGTFTVAADGLYIFDARANEDLVMTLRSADGGTVASNDDRGNELRLGGDRLDPLLIEELIAGDYEVTLAEYFGNQTSFDLEIREVTEAIETGRALDAAVAVDGYWAGALTLTDANTVTIDVEAVDGGDPVLVVQGTEATSPLYNDDRDTGGLNPLLRESLEAGTYVVVVYEYWGAGTDVQVSVS